MENTVKITLWDNTVGCLTWDSSDWRKESSVFKFDSSFLEKGLDISPLQMSINSPARKAGIPVRGGNPKDLFKGLPLRRFVAGPLGQQHFQGMGEGARCFDEKNLPGGYAGVCRQAGNGGS